MNIVTIGAVRLNVDLIKKRVSLENFGLPALPYVPAGGGEHGAWRGDPRQPLLTGNYPRRTGHYSTLDALAFCTMHQSVLIRGQINRRKLMSLEIRDNATMRAI
jgi:hypothetical protein